MTRPRETLADLEPKTREFVVWLRTQDSAMRRAVLDCMRFFKAKVIDIPNAALGAWVYRRAARYRARSAGASSPKVPKVIPFPRAP